MAAAIPFMMIAGAVMSAMSSMSQASAAKDAADRNAVIQTQNAGIATQNAADQNVQNQRDNYMRLGAIRANAGKNGGTGDSGNVLDILGDVGAQGELEKQYTTYQGQLQARGYTNTSSLDTAQGQNAQTSGYLKAGTELFKGASSYANADSQLVRT